MRVTIADVARAAGVSKSAVPWVLNAEGEADGRTVLPAEPVDRAPAPVPALAP